MFPHCIPDQLMYLPHNSSQEPADPEKVPLKTILMWNGVRSWGGVVGGRGEFLKQNCPVNTCVLSSDKNKQNTADLILFKVEMMLILPVFHSIVPQLSNIPLCFVLIKISTLINLHKGAEKF